MRLFKYVRAERVDIIENQQIAFTPPEDFNDVLDTRPKVLPVTSRTVLKRRAKEQEASVLRHLPPSFRSLPRKERREKERELLKGSIKYLQKNADEIAIQLQQQIRTGVSKYFGILCLTTNSDDKLMWGIYADGHRGFILEFNTENPRFALTGDVHRVEYSTTPAIYDPAVGSQGWWKIKSKEWEYEKEYRIVSSLEKCEKVFSGGKTKYLRHMPRECVKAVYLGLQMEESKKRTLGEICQQSGIEVFEAAFSKDGVSHEFRKPK